MCVSVISPDVKQNLIDIFQRNWKIFRNNIEKKKLFIYIGFVFFVFLFINKSLEN